VDNQTHQIVDADIALNPNRTFRVLPPEGLLNTPYDDIQNALTHELGHALGLAHNPDLTSAVMYPSARAGETVKRTLSPDDLDAISALYGLPAPDGCSTARASPAWLALLALALFAFKPLRKKAPLAVCLLFVPLAARAADSERPPAPAESAQAVLVAHVIQLRTLPPAQAHGPVLLFSEVTLKVDRCLKGSCPASIVVRMAGGTLGHLEQFVADSPLPATGDPVGLTVEPGADVAAPAISQTRIYALQRARDFSAFAKGLSAAHLDAAIR